MVDKEEVNKAVEETKNLKELYENGSTEDKITVLIRMKDKSLISLSIFGIGCFLNILLVFSTQSQFFAKTYFMTSIGFGIAFLSSLFFFIK